MDRIQVVEETEYPRPKRDAGKRGTFRFGKADGHGHYRSVDHCAVERAPGEVVRAPLTQSL